MSFETCASHRLSSVKLEKCHNSVIYDPILTISKMFIKFYQYEAFCVDFVAYLQKF